MKKKYTGEAIKKNISYINKRTMNTKDLYSIVSNNLLNFFDKYSLFFTLLKNPYNESQNIPNNNNIYLYPINKNYDDNLNINITDYVFSDSKDICYIYSVYTNNIKISYDNTIPIINMNLELIFNIEEVLNMFRNKNIFPEYYGYMILIKENMGIRTEFNIIDIFNYTRPLMVVPEDDPVKTIKLNITLNTNIKSEKVVAE